MDLGRWLLQLGVHMLLGKLELKSKALATGYTERVWPGHVLLGRNNENI